MGNVDHATHAFGLATPSGIISTTPQLETIDTRLDPPGEASGAGH